MRGQDAKGCSVQGTSHAQRALPDARRGEHWATHLGRLGAFKAGQFETRPVFCQGETGGEVASPVAARLQGTVPRYNGIVPMTNGNSVRCREPLKQILIDTQDYWDHPGTRPAVRENFRRMINCRTPALGAEIFASENQEM